MRRKKGRWKLERTKRSKLTLNEFLGANPRPPKFYNFFPLDDLSSSLSQSSSSVNETNKEEREKAERESQAGEES